MTEIYTISRLVEILNGLRHDQGDLEVRIDSNDFDSARLIHSVNYATNDKNEKFICLNNFD